MSDESPKRGRPTDPGTGELPLPEPGESPVGVEYAAPDERLKPIYLLADSQLLFWDGEPGGLSFVERVREQISAAVASAVYIGASNGDEPAYYSIFEAAMDKAGVTERTMVHSEPSSDELAAVDGADWIVLAGGDVARGWRTFQVNGLSRILVRRYYEGTILTGISAGAMQLGLGFGQFASEGPGEVVDTLRLVPHLIGAHDEAAGWPELERTLLAAGGHTQAFGIPTGGGLAYHPDHVLEPLRRPVTELRLRQGEVIQSVITYSKVDTGDAEQGDLDLGALEPNDRGPVN